MLRRCLFFFLLALMLVACGSEQAARKTMDVSGVWGRPSPMMAETAAFYMQVVNNTGRDDALLGVSTAKCGRVELHESKMDDQGVMSMNPVEGGQITLADGETVRLQPGGLHVMCTQLAAPLQVGDQVPLTLEFAEQGEMVVQAQIQEEAPQ